MRAELLKLPGVLAVTYAADHDLFSVQFEDVVVDLETIFTAVFMAGREMGREYFPEVIS